MLSFFFDAPSKKQFFFQDSASAFMERIIDLHNDVFTFLIFIILFVTWILFRSIFLFGETNISTLRFSFQHNTVVEQIWTIVPALLLLLISLPSCCLIYLLEELNNPLLTIKITGYQWYWNYCYNELPYIQFDAFLLQEEDLKPGSYRLLEVDFALVLPIDLPIRVLTTSADVIHSWTVPSLGVKLDAVPGRTSQTTLFIIREGIFYGQCSELCGLNHGFMPIVVKCVDIQTWINWTYNQEPFTN